MKAFHEGHTDAVRVLFEHGASPDVQDKQQFIHDINVTFHGMTLLMAAAEKGHITLISCMNCACLEHRDSPRAQITRTASVCPS